VVVVGAARSGVAAAELAAKWGARVTLTEMRETFDGADRLRAQGVELELGGHKAETLASADLIVTSPGVPIEQPAFDAARTKGVETIGELEFAWRWVKGQVIAITGTKGKSTTATLIGRMLTAHEDRLAGAVLVGGNIGTPLSAQVENADEWTTHVVEVSSFQLETTTTFRPHIAVWLNFTDDHLDRHPTIEAYAAAKARIFANQEATDWAVVNADDAEVMRRVQRTPARRVEFSTKGSVSSGVDAFVIDGGWIIRRTGTVVERLIPVNAVELTGRHMLTNVLAAAAASRIAGAGPDEMLRALRGFHGLPHVMEPAGEVRGVRFVNDSKATNVEAARRSIESFDRGVVAIIGGRYKGGDFGELRDPLATRGRSVIAIGEARDRIRSALAGTVPVIEAASMAEAVTRGYEAARPDGIVLLAPACSSFDWFRDYAERGEVFKQEVKRLRDEMDGDWTRERS
jgi:UDP-N-acetylmuramoylalanine--D-glutamate ligase